jgi:hypothetical protein
MMNGFTKTTLLRLTVAAVAMLLILPSLARADLDIQGSSSGTYFTTTGTATWDELTFTPNDFSVTASGDTVLLEGANSLGHFDLATCTGSLLSCPDWFVGDDTFHLLLTFTAPSGVTGDSSDSVFTADLFGAVTRSAGFVSLLFDTWSKTFTYENASGTGSFTLSLYPTQILLGHDIVTVYAGGSGVDLTAKIDQISFTPTPEAGTVMSLLVMIGGLGICGLRLRRTS